VGHFGSFGGAAQIVPRGTIWERGRVGHFVKQIYSTLLIPKSEDLRGIMAVCASPEMQKSRYRKSYQNRPLGGLFCG